MTTYSIKAPDGNTYQIDGPAGASQQDVEAEVLKQHPDAGNAPAPSALSTVGKVAAAPVRAAANDVIGMGRQVSQQLGKEYFGGQENPVTDVMNAAADVYQGAVDKYLPPPTSTAGKATEKGLEITLGLGLGGSAGAEEVTEEHAADAARAAFRASQYIAKRTGLTWNDLSADFKRMLTDIAKDAKNLDHLDPKAVEREARASKLGVPITRGQATRDASQLTKEENLRRSDAGRPLREMQVAQDQALHHNLDVLRGEVAPGSKVQTATDVGRSIQDAARAKLEALEARKNALYEKAKNSGDMKAPVNISPLKQWMQDPRNARNASWLKSAISDYERSEAPEAPGRIDLGTSPSAARRAGAPPTPAHERPVKTGQVTINDLEEIRKEAVARTLGPPSTEGHFAGEAIKVIDDILDKSGGSVYREARAANKAIKAEFDRQGIMRRLTGEKGRTTDRAVALEDTLDTVVVRGSNEDLQKVKASLMSTPKGQQAWADLQAGAIDYLRRAAGGKRGIANEAGDSQFNSTFIDALHDLDQDGKLETLFGPRVAERARLIAKTVADIRTTPSMRISGSDTVPRIISMLEKVRHIPGAGHLVRAGASVIRGVAQRSRDTADLEAARSSPLSIAAKAATKPPSKISRYGVSALGGATVGAMAPDYGESEP